MTDDQDRVTLTVDGMDYAGWLKIEISAGIERQARDFALDVTWRWPGSEARPLRIRQGARCQVRIGADLVLTGYVDATPIQYDKTNVTTSVRGRSLTADLIDCSVSQTPGQWRGQTVLQVVRGLASQYGITVLDESGDAATVADHTVEPGETVFESIDRLLSLSELLSTDDEHGRLVLVQPGSAGRARDALELGKNIVTGSASLDFSDVFSEYQCIGQRAGTDDEFGAAASEVSASVADDRVTRRRLKVVQPSGNVSALLAQRRAEWERDSSLARALSTEYEVQGWRQSSGDLWRTNLIVRVKDDLIGFDRDMLISEVTYTLDERGTKSRLRVAPPEAFNPEPGKGRKKGKKGKGGDSFEYLLPADWEKQQ
ncbi:baseplate protein [Alcaligenaceae bacterium SJ-26]|nr:baseplate protein [Alcaligenaceae bacterium SJ-26]